LLDEIGACLFPKPASFVSCRKKSVGWEVNHVGGYPCRAAAVT
jgi:hypothetical protein